MMGRLAGLDRRRTDERTDELLARFDLVEVADRRAGSYSGGTRRRLDLAVGLLDVAPVLFLDEPTTGLDTRGRQELWQVRPGGRRSRFDRVPDHAVPRGSRSARRPSRRHRWREHRRRGHAGRAQVARVGVELLELQFHDDAALAAAAAALPQAQAGPACCSVPTNGRIDEVRRALDRRWLPARSTSPTSPRGHRRSTTSSSSLTTSRKLTVVMTTIAHSRSESAMRTAARPRVRHRRSTFIVSQRAPHRCASSTPMITALALPVIIMLLFVYIFGGAVEVGTRVRRLRGPRDHPAVRRASAPPARRSVCARTRSEVVDVVLFDLSVDDGHQCGVAAEGVDDLGDHQ